ncbi:MAG TPA: 50S ribosomal protein L23 [Clostridiales bacterium]|nr:50S ribosomal protein L23 [Clostridiales bacterium]
MADLKYYDVILKPVITEASMKNMNVQVQKVKKQLVEESGKKVLKAVKDKTGKVQREEIEIRKYTFLVNPLSTKTQVKEAVEKMFVGVKVKAITTSLTDGKTKRRGNTQGKTSKKKKAIVTLTQDSKDIELFAK